MSKRQRARYRGTHLVRAQMEDMMTKKERFELGKGWSASSARLDGDD